jgi:hypothetical protein
MHTCSKLGIAFGDYLGDRLRTPHRLAVPYLPDLIGSRLQLARAVLPELLPRLRGIV